MEFIFSLTILFMSIKCLFCILPDVSGYYPDISGGVEFEDGDLIISGLFDLHKYDEEKACGIQVDISGTYRALAFIYAIEKINENRYILPNVTLGYVFLDCCKKGTTALARTLYTVPDKRHLSDACFKSIDKSCIGGFDYFPVTGSIGPQSSLIARLTTSALGLFQIPQISNYVTSDEYSSGVKYPYFLRTAPPDRFQVLAMQSIFEHFGWKYISTVYEDGYYGRAALKALTATMEQIGACFGVREMVDHSTTTTEWDEIVDHLLKFDKARVVVMFLYSKPSMTFIEALERQNAQDKFILIASDTISVLMTTPKYLDELPGGMLGVAISASNVPDFDSYVGSFDTAKANRTYVMRALWEDMFNCSLGHNAKNACRPDLTMRNARQFISDPLASVVIDSVNVMALGIHKVISEKCRLAVGKALRDCVNGPELILELRNTSHSGISGQIEFNQSGDMIGQYDIVNIQRTTNGRKAVVVASYDIKQDRLDVLSEFRWPSGVNETGIPVSICSKPCKPGQQMIQKDVHCCWECRDCRENERTIQNRSKCMRCPKFFWPDQETFSSCVEIVPTVLHWSDLECVVVTTLTIIGLILSGAILFLFTKHRNKKLIKASSIEVMFVILIAVFSSLLMVFSFLSYPVLVTCYANFFGFHVSFTASYAPILVKARRIYAIFASGKKTTKAPPLISSQSQVIMCLILIAIQIFMCFIISLLDGPYPQKSMPVPTVRVVELGCHGNSMIMLGPLCYNLVLVLACTIYAFKSRGIPANFKETRFISFSVYTTLILWMALIPTYYTTDSEKLKIIYLTSAMIIHSYVINICLFLPKLYAVIYIKEEDLHGIEGRVGSSHANGPSVIGMQNVKKNDSSKRYSDEVSLS